jgi:uncharacterized protein (TIGR03067 family)
MLSWFAPFLIVLAPVGLADEPVAPPELQGAWRLVAVEVLGRMEDLSDTAPRVEIRDDRLRYGGEEIARLTADATTMPKVIDLKFPTPERTFEGIYRLGDGKLDICLSTQTDGVKERPSEYATAGKPGRNRLTFERVGAEDKDPAEGLRGYVGVALAFNEETEEVRVAATLENSPARKAGLEEGDIVEEIGGKEVATLRFAVATVRAAKPGSRLVFHVKRGEATKDIPITVAVVPFEILALLF